jgi:hypothetical protein
MKYPSNNKDIREENIFEAHANGISDDMSQHLIIKFHNGTQIGSFSYRDFMRSGLGIFKFELRDRIYRDAGLFPRS